MSQRATTGIVVVAVLLFGVSAFAQDVSLPLPIKKGHPKLESLLDQLAEAYRTGGLREAQAFAEHSAIDLVDAKVRVVLEANNKEKLFAVIKTLQELGGRVELTYEHLIQALVPVEALEPLAASPEVHLIRLPVPLMPAQGSIVSQGVEVIKADAWQKAGITGKGVKVAVLDIGFRGLTSLQRLGELPADIVTRSFRTDDSGLDGGTPHGSAVAEVIFDVAPGVQFFFANLATDIEFFQAADWAISQKVDVINTSVGRPPDCVVPGDSWLWGKKAKEARDAGILWASSAGNSADVHWAGEFKDDDANGFHNFLGTDETNTIEARSGEIISLWLIWDDPCEKSANDYDLYLLDSDNKIVARSEDEQIGRQQPRERITIRAPRSGLYHIKIKKAQATRAVKFNLFIRSKQQPEYVEPTGSISEPALAAAIVAVGATFWRDDKLEPFSSQGRPGEGKPNLVAPDGVTSATYMRFDGTSASSPHVAGAAALVKQAFPNFTPEQIQKFLEERAEDLGPPGKDNMYGAGRLNLGPVPAQQPTIGLNPTSFSFTAVQGGLNPPAQTLNITNTGSGTLNWTVRAVDAPWLRLSPTSGNVPPPSAVSVSVEIAGLAAGSFAGRIVIEALGATNSPLSVPVTLTIIPPGVGQLIALKFIKLEFVDPTAWKFELKDGCVVYTNISGAPTKLRVTAPDSSVLEFDIPAGKSVIMCGDIVHIDTRTG